MALVHFAEGASPVVWPSSPVLPAWVDPALGHSSASSRRRRLAPIHQLIDFPRWVSGWSSLRDRDTVGHCSCWCCPQHWDVRHVMPTYTESCGPAGARKGSPQANQCQMWVISCSFGVTAGRCLAICRTRCCCRSVASWSWCTDTEERRAWVSSSFPMRPSEGTTPTLGSSVPLWALQSQGLPSASPPLRIGRPRPGGDESHCSQVCSARRGRKRTIWLWGKGPFHPSQGSGTGRSEQRLFPNLC